MISQQYRNIRGPMHHITESYVSSPPALWIMDEWGTTWKLGNQTMDPRLSPDGEFAFEVLMNSIGTGYIASRIERRNGKVRIFTRDGWLNWTGRSFV